MLYTNYQATFTDLFVDFNNRFDNLTDSWCKIIDLEAETMDFNDFIINLGSIHRMFKKFPSDLHSEFLQPKVEILYDYLINEVKDITTLSSVEMKFMDTTIEIIEKYCYDLTLSDYGIY